MSAAFERAFDAALGRALPGVFPGAVATVIAADASDPVRLELALGRLLAVLPRAGVPRGRVIVLLAATAEGDAREAALARRWRADLGVPVLAHHPARSACFTVARVRGTPIEVSDELREAEAVLALGPLAAGADARAIHDVVLPGLGSESTRAACAARPRLLEDARAALACDLALGWRAAGAHGWEVLAGRQPARP